MKVLKFGGTSVGNAKNIKKVVEIITNINEQKIIVLSAISGTTNSLLDIYKRIKENQQPEALEVISNLEVNYLLLVNQLFTTKIYQQKAIDFVTENFYTRRKLTQKTANLIVENRTVAQ